MTGVESRRGRLARPGQRHRLRILQVRHHHGRDGQHEAAEDLLGVVVDARVGEADAGAEEGDPGRPLQLHHQAAHAEHHRQHVHVVGCRVVAGRARRAERCGLVPRRNAK